MPARLLTHALAGLRGVLAAQARGWARSSRAALARAWTGRPSGRRSTAIGTLVALAAAGAVAVLAQAGRVGRLPGTLDWHAAAALLARDARPGDAVVVAPAWLERVREIAPGGVPVIATARLDGEPLPGVIRAWLVSAPGAASGREARAALSRRAARTDVQRLGALEVTRFDLTAPVQPLASLAEHARAPAVAAIREAGGLPRRCLVVTPTPEEPLTLSFPGLRLGRTLAGHAALLPGVGDAPVRLAFEVDGEELGAVEVRPADGWLAFEVETSRTGLGAHDVAVVATTTGDAARPVCLEALALP